MEQKKKNKEHLNNIYRLARSHQSTLHRQKLTKLNKKINTRYSQDKKTATSSGYGKRKIGSYLCSFLLLNSRLPDEQEGKARGFEVQPVPCWQNSGSEKKKRHFSPCFRSLARLHWRLRRSEGVYTCYFLPISTLCNSTQAAEKNRSGSCLLRRLCDNCPHF